MQPVKAVHAVSEAAQHTHDRYAQGAERPLGGYIALLGTYATLTTAATVLVRRRGRLATRLRPADLVLLALTTFRVTRLVTKDSVTAVVRSPFTEFKEPAGEGEVNEEVTGSGLRHAIGELVTCPFCMGQWVATAATTSMLVAPDFTRFASTICATGVASDVLQLAYSKTKETLS